MQEVWRIVLPCPAGSSLPGSAATGRPCRGAEAHAANNVTIVTPPATSVHFAQITVRPKPDTTYDAVGWFANLSVDVGVEGARDDAPAASDLNEDPVVARLGESVGKGNSRGQPVAGMRV